MPSRMLQIPPPKTTSLFNDLDFSIIKVFNILEKLNTSKSPDVDGFANEMIKKIAREIAESLLLHMGCVPLAGRMP